MDNMKPLRAQLQEHLRQNGLKNTRQRQVILDAFLASNGHMAIDDLLLAVQARMSGVGHATIYRTMKLFTEAGIAHERRFGDGQARYEPVVLGEHHDHLICEDCGHIFEFEDPLIEERQDSIARQRGLQISHHRHEIFGRCMHADVCEHNQ